MINYDSNYSVDDYDDSDNDDDSDDDYSVDSMIMMMIGGDDGDNDDGSVDNYRKSSEYHLKTATYIGDPLVVNFFSKNF
jgi:hypothetical protein